MNDLEPALRQPMLHLPSRQPELEELWPRDHTMLSLRKLPDPPLNEIVSTFATYVVVNVERLRHGGDRGAPRERSGRRT
jgi:hypothetical protein